MKTFILEMKTPEGEVVDDEVEYVVLPSSEGGYGVLASHAPVVLWLDTGVCEYVKNGERKRYFIMEGVADVTGEKVSVLSDFIVAEEDAEEALDERERYYAAEKKRRKDSYFEYKQSSIGLARAMRNLSSKKEDPHI